MRCFLITLGCPKNSVDSEMMGELLAEAGHTLVASPERADILIANTCGFIEAAREESLDTLVALAASKRKRQRLVAAGCMAERFADLIRAKVPAVDAILGTQSWPQIVRVVNQFAKKSTALEVEPRADEKDLIRSIKRHAVMGASAYLKIADGCDASCAFCAIPLIKGRQRSKPSHEILREARELQDESVREVILIAQDTTAYGRDLGISDTLPNLLRQIAGHAPEIDWLRIMYAYPQHISDELVDTMASLPQVCHYLDLPLQHGDPRVLQRMRRPHDVESLHRSIAKLRQAMPDIALRSTFIVGFPGETEEEFETLLAFMREIEFDKVGVFAYSREEGTQAASMPDQVAAERVAERFDRAMLTQQEISLQRNQAQLGREFDVLIEGVGEDISVGRTYRDAPEIDGLVLLPGEMPIGELIRARITEAQEYDLIATPIV